MPFVPGSAAAIDSIICRATGVTWTGVRFLSRALSMRPRRAIAPPRIGRAAWPPGPRTVASMWHIRFSATWIG